LTAGLFAFALGEPRRQVTHVGNATDGRGNRRLARVDPQRLDTRLRRTVDVRSMRIAHMQAQGCFQPETLACEIEKMAMRLPQPDFIRDHDRVEKIGQAVAT